MRPVSILEAGIAAHRRLEHALGTLTDDDVRRPSLLPGWSRGHVLTHVAHKTVSHVWMLEGARQNEVRHQHPSGFDHAQAEVAAESGRSAAELRDDVVRSFAQLEAAWAELPDECWERMGICVPGPRSMADIAGRHLRDVEVHHVDLDIGYTPADWSTVFVDYELPKRLAGLSSRTNPASLLAWLLDRADAPELGPW